MLLFAVIPIAIFVVCLSVIVGLDLRDRRRRVLPTDPGLYLKRVKSRIGERGTYRPGMLAVRNE
jgi:hypothetical protein